MPNHFISQTNIIYSRQTTKPGRSIVKFNEFQVAFTVSSVVGNPVHERFIVAERLKRLTHKTSKRLDRSGQNFVWQLT